MVWLNNNHFNTAAPKGSFGGAYCICDECAKKRKQNISQLPDIPPDVWPELYEDD